MPTIREPAPFDRPLRDAISVAVADTPVVCLLGPHLLETFAVQQFIAQAGWTVPELEFSHYRDKDQVEVDLVINRGRDVLGRGGESCRHRHACRRQGVAPPRRSMRQIFPCGVLLHAGNVAIKLAVENCLAVPPARLRDM